MKYNWLGFLLLGLFLSACGLEQTSTSDQAVGGGEAVLQSEPVQSALEKVENEYGLAFDLSKAEEGYAPSGGKLLRVFADDKSAIFSVGLVGDEIAFVDVDRLSGDLESLSSEDSLITLYENLDALGGEALELEPEGKQQRPLESDALQPTQQKECTSLQRTQIARVKGNIQRLAGERIRAQGAINTATANHTNAKNNYFAAQRALAVCLSGNAPTCVTAILNADRTKWLLYYARQNLDSAERTLADIDRKLQSETWTLADYIRNWPECKPI